MLRERAEEIVKEAEEITEILCEDSQALWVVLHRSLAHKFDYHLSLSYPSDIRPVATYLDSGLWSMMVKLLVNKFLGLTKGWATSAFWTCL